MPLGRFNSALKLTSCNPLLVDVDRLRLFHAASGDGGPQHDFDCSFLDRVVMHGDGDLGRVAVGEGQRQPDLAEEVLLHGQVVGRLAGQGLGREAFGQELPGGGSSGTVRLTVAVPSAPVVTTGFQ